MQKICSVNELRATFMFRPSFILAPTHPGPAGYVLYTKSADQQCSILLQDYTALAPDASQRRPPMSPLRPTHCPTGPSAHLRKHDLSMKGTPAHIQVGEGQPAALLNVRINGMPRSVRSINAGFSFPFQYDVASITKTQCFFFLFFFPPM